MRRGPIARALGLGLLLGTIGGAGVPAYADEKASLPGIEDEFKAAIRKVTPATVVCMAKDAAPGQTGSSGVVVSKKGLVLSDGDAALVLKPNGDRSHDADVVEVRVPVVTGNNITFKSYQAKVLRLDRNADTSLLRILDAPSAGMPAWLTMGSSDDLAVGDFTFAMGNSFGLSSEAPPSLTAGVVASLVPAAAERGEGRYETLYTSAAVNPGVNGGPLVDIEGRLVGTISTFVMPTKDDPYQFLGKAVPIQRLRKVYADLPDAQELFPEAKPAKARSDQAAALETSFARAAQTAYGSVASLLVERSAPYTFFAQVAPNVMLPTARFQGPSSALVVSAEGELVTSLYNLTNITTLTNPPAPRDVVDPRLALEAGLTTITKITVCMPDGRSFPAKLVSHDPRTGVALLKADLPAGVALPVLAPVPPEIWREGRFALALGNPFGRTLRPSPLLTVGILSKAHAATAPWAWRGDWQTDAGVTDANTGGALVDLRGRLYGMLHLWAPLSHGRSSGIGFVVPWSAIERALPDLRAGRVFKRGFIGLAWKQNADLPTVEAVLPGTPASTVDIQVGDRLLTVDGAKVEDQNDAVRLLRHGWEGDSVRLTFERRAAKSPITIELRLGARPEGP